MESISTKFIMNNFELFKEFQYISNDQIHDHLLTIRDTLSFDNILGLLESSDLPEKYKIVINKFCFSWIMQNPDKIPHDEYSYLKEISIAKSINCQIYGKSVLTWGVHFGHLEIMKLLLQNNADINYRGWDEITPLMAASMEGHVDIARYLLQQGADYKISNSHGETALTWALWTHHLEIVELLKTY